ncbi:MAG: hypothetical protein DYG89_05615 [Caldilinea sp. CFX5]|nr:hypothetical protein [Caldilinea sp. CFX5]
MKALFRQMSVYGLGGVITKAVNFLLVPLYTRVLAPADYGALELIYLMGGVLAILYGFMIRSGYVRNYYEFKDENTRNSLFSTAFWFTAVTSLTFLFISYILADEITASLLNFPEGSYALHLISFATAIYALSHLFYGWLMVKEKAQQFVMINVASLLVTICSTIYFIVILQWSFIGILYAQIIGRLFELCWLAYLARQLRITHFSYSLAVPMLHYGLPLIPVQLAAFVLDLSDRAFLNHYSTLYEVGLYAFGYKLASVILLFVTEPLRGFTPYLFSLIDDPEKCKRTLADFTRYYILVVLLLILLLSIFAREAVFILADASYQTSWRVVYFIALSYGIYGLVLLSSYAIEIVKKNWISSFFWLAGAGLNIVLNFLLIPAYGMMGASFATTISYLCVLFGYWIVIKRLYPISYAYGRFLYILIVTTLIYALSTTIDTNLILAIVLKTGLLGLFLGFVVLGQYLTREEMSIVGHFLTGSLIQRLHWGRV